MRKALFSFLLFFFTPCFASETPSWDGALRLASLSASPEEIAILAESDEGNDVAPLSAPEPDKVLYVLGDSLSAAYNIPRESGWVALLDNRLKNCKTHYQVINGSISGETTRGGLARLEPALQAHQPIWVVIELGANDGLRGLPLNRTKENLRQMISQSQAAGAKVLLIGNRIPPNYGPIYTRSFFQLFASLSEEFDIPSVPFMLKDVADKPELMQSDQLHPTAEAQPQILDNVWEIWGNSLCPEFAP
jgi:acyl-CoA thioesterase I